MVKKDKHIKPGYHLTEVGIVPADWKLEKLGDIGKGLIGLTYKPENVKKYGTLVLRSSNIQEEKFAFNDNVYVDLEISPETLIRENDILICTRNGSRDLIGKSILIPKQYQGYSFGAFMCVYRSQYGEYISHLFRSPIVKKQINQYLGATINQITNSSLKSFMVPLPEKGEQSAITHALSNTDALISSLDELINKKVQIRDTSVNTLLKGKMRLPGFEKLIGVKESILGIIPNDWNVKPLPEVIVHIHGKAHERHIEKYGKYIVVNSKFISTEGEIRKYSNENFCPAKANDILTVLSDLPNGKALAKCYYVEENNQYAVNQRVCIWRSKGDHPKYLHYILNRNAYFLGLNDGVSQTHILNHHIQKCPLLIPSDINEQIAIAKVISDMDIEISELENKRDKYKQIKQGMMSELLTGNIRLLGVK